MWTPKIQGNVRAAAWSLVQKPDRCPQEVARGWLTRWMAIGYRGQGLRLTRLRGFPLAGLVLGFGDLVRRERFLYGGGRPDG